MPHVPSGNTRSQASIYGAHCHSEAHAHHNANTFSGVCFHTSTSADRQASSRSNAMDLPVEVHAALGTTGTTQG